MPSHSQCIYVLFEFIIIHCIQQKAKKAAEEALKECEQYTEDIKKLQELWSKDIDPQLEKEILHAAKKGYHSCNTEINTGMIHHRLNDRAKQDFERDAAEQLKALGYKVNNIHLDLWDKLTIDVNWPEYSKSGYMSRIFNTQQT